MSREPYLILLIGALTLTISGLRLTSTTNRLEARAYFVGDVKPLPWYWRDLGLAATVVGGMIAGYALMHIFLES